MRYLCLPNIKQLNALIDARSCRTLGQDEPNHVQKTRLQCCVLVHLRASVSSSWLQQYMQSNLANRLLVVGNQEDTLPHGIRIQQTVSYPDAMAATPFAHLQPTAMFV